MRIIGGTLRGRTLKAPEGLNTRPTTDRVREALFNILAHHEWGRDVLENAVVLDAFAGTGALGIEALSHGAASSYFFEKDRKATKILRENIAALELGSSAHLYPMDVLKPTEAPEACTLVFLDPPYRQGLIPLTLEALAAKGWIAPEALLVLETAKDERLPPLPTYTSRLTRTYGDTTLSFFTLPGARSG